MIYFVTEQRERHKVVDNNEVTVLSNNSALNIYKWQQFELVGIDTETNGLDPYLNQILLYQFGNEEIQFVIDVTSVDITNWFNPHWKLILQNGKFDTKMLKAQKGIELTYFWDVMVADQILFKGCGKSQERPDGMSFNLPSIHERHLGYIPEHMDKSTRDEFVGISPDKFVATQRHIMYGAGDVKALIPIFKSQKERLKKIDNKYMDLSKYLISCVADMELAGWRLDIPAWKKLIENNRQQAWNTACELDEIMRDLRTNLPKNVKNYLVGGKYDRIRGQQQVIQQTNLFGGTDEEYYKGGVKSNVNWSSTDQVVKIAGALGLHLPIKDAKDVPYAVPKLVEIKSKDSVKLTVDNTKYTTDSDQLAQMLAQFPAHPGKEMIKKLIAYREYDHAANAFGDNFLKNINPITGRIHTIFRTDTAVNHRFQSGERGTRYINFQNIPADNAYRNCFIARDGYLIANNDLSGAEVTIMCDKANDQKLYEWAVKNDDAHSPIATACWRNVFLYRAGLMTGAWSDPKEFKIRKHYKNIHDSLSINIFKDVRENYELFKTYIIDKNTNKDKRRIFKSMTFGTVYGLYAGKGSQTLGIPKDEAQVVIDTIKESIPDTFRYVEGCASFALKNGWLQIDDRWNTRVYFPEVYKAKKANLELKDYNWKAASDIEGLARNVTISGTQALMIKEAIVELSLAHKAYSINARILNAVHDELNIEFHGFYLEPCLYWHSDKIKKDYGIKSLYQPVTQRLGEKVAMKYIEKGEIKFVNYPEFSRLTMIEVANRYLKHFKMGATSEVGPYWIK